MDNACGRWRRVLLLVYATNVQLDLAVNVQSAQLEQQQPQQRQLGR